MALTPADVIALAPEFSARTDIQQWLDIVEARIDRSIASNEDLADAMTIFLTAHYLKSFPESGATSSPGALTSASVDGVSKSKAAVSAVGSTAILASTKWGAQYLELVGATFVPRVI